MLQILAENVITEDNFSISCCIVSLDKGNLLLITDQSNYGIGNVILGAPPLLEGSHALSSPAPLFGLKKSILGKMIAELTATKLRQPCLILSHIVGLEKKDDFVAKLALKCVRKTIEKIK